MMRNKLISGLLSLFSAAALLTELAPISVKCSEYTVGEIQSLADGIVAYELNNSGAADIQDWIFGTLSSQAGYSSEWYILTLSQCGDYDFSTYEKALKEYLSGASVSSASSREKYALALISVGSTDSYISQTIADSTGQQGIMSYIYGEHILNNGFTGGDFTAENVADTLVSMQLDDGGWSIFGSYGDVDVTAMTIQALAPHYSESQTVSQSIDRAVDFLSSKQQENGGFKSMGAENPESASQVLTALSALGIDCLSDERFIRNGNTVIDGIVNYRLDDGSFCHTLDGGSNPTATIQAYYSLVSYLRMSEGKAPLYILDNRRPPSANTVAPDNNSGVNGEAVQNPTAVSTSPASSVENPEPETPQNDNIKDENKPQTEISTAKVSASLKTSVSAATILTTAGSVSTASAENNTSAGELKTTYASTQKASSATDSKQDSAPKKSGSYKVGVIIVVWASIGVLSLIFVILRKRNWKNFAALAILGAGVTVVILVTDIKSADEYYSGEKMVKENVIGEVTMTIRCDTIAGENEYAPADGVIFETTDFELTEGETVWDILTQAAQTYSIQIDSTNGSMVYVAGINYLYEFDFGDLSGWIYHVNGVAPSVGCAEYELQDGDKIEWLYTRELGNDLLQEEQ